MWSFWPLVRKFCVFVWSSACAKVHRLEKVTVCNISPNTSDKIAFFYKLLYTKHTTALTLMQSVLFVEIPSSLAAPAQTKASIFLTERLMEMQSTKAQHRLKHQHSISSSIELSTCCRWCYIEAAAICST